MFVLIHRWENRKGWDVLLAAYLTQFTFKDRVQLIILTHPFVGSSDIKGEQGVELCLGCGLDEVWNSGRLGARSGCMAASQQDPARACALLMGTAWSAGCWLPLVVWVV